jgi:hypothetical protein
MTKNNLEKKELIEKNIRQEKDMIENYERENNLLQNQIWDYENDLNEDYSSEIEDLIDNMVINENLIRRCEIEIEIYEDELEKDKHLFSNNLNQSNFKLNSIDDIRNHFGYISSSNLLKLWIMRFSVNELVNDLKWIYNDDNETLNEISKLLK